MIKKTIQQQTLEFKLLAGHGLCLHIVLCITVYEMDTFLTRGFIVSELYTCNLNQNWCVKAGKVKVKVKLSLRTP